jgi:hypothetical protein
MSTTPTAKTIQALYEKDYNLWVETTVKHLRSGRFDAIDLENLIEEVADLSRRERDKLTSLLTRLFEHLLKLAYWHSQREYNAPHWKAEIANFRIQIKKLLKNSPSLKPYLIEIFDESYSDARKIIIQLTQLNPDTFPTKAIATLEEVLAEDWFPVNL